MSEQEPTRLFSGGLGPSSLYPALRIELEAARRAGPSAEQRARLRERLGLPVQPAAPPVPSRAEVVSLVGGGWRLIALGLSIAGLLSAEPPTTIRTSTSVSPEAVGSEPSAAVSGSTVVSERQLESAPASTPSPPPARAGARRKHAVAGTRAPTPSVRQDPSLLGEELRLLKRARSRARSEPALALQLVGEHEQRFSSGEFRQEREVIAIEALLMSEQRDRAKARAERFFRDYPGSAHVRRVRALLAEEREAVSSNQKN